MNNKSDDGPKIGEILYQDLTLTRTAFLTQRNVPRPKALSPKQYGLHHEDLITWYLNDGSNRQSTEWLFAEEVANDR